MGNTYTSFATGKSRFQGEFRRFSDHYAGIGRPGNDIHIKTLPAYHFIKDYKCRFASAMPVIQ